MQKPHFKSLVYNDEINWNLNNKKITALTEFKTKLEDGFYKFMDTSSLCGAIPNTEESLLLGCKDRYGLAVNTWLSRRSGLLWTSPRMSFESLQKFYAEDYRNIYSGNTEPDISFYCRQANHGKSISDWIAKKTDIDFNKHGTVLDIGCGAGGMLEPFKDIGWKTYGCDYNDKYLNYGRKKGLTLKSGNIEALDEFGKADLIIMSHVLEHDIDPKALLNAAKTRLAADGILFISLPGIMNLAPYRWQFVRYLQNAHLFHFSKNNLKILASKCGLKVVAADESIKMALKKCSSKEEMEWDASEAQRILNYLHHPTTLFERVGLQLNKLLNIAGYKISKA